MTATAPAPVDPYYRQPFVGEPNSLMHTGFLLAEDQALHRYLSGILVPTRPDAETTEQVGVWFRFPEGERQIKYPFITIDMVDVAPDYPLWTSEYVVDPTDLYRPSVSPTLPDPGVNMGYQVRPYLPFLITYQVTVHCRSALHDRYLNSIFMTDIIPPRPFWIGVDADNTWRRTEMVDFAQSDIPETTESGNKRIFRKMYTLSMMAEIPQDTLADQLRWQVLKVYVGITDRAFVEEYLEVLSSVDSDPFTNIDIETRQDAGELSYYVNDDSKSVEAGVASAVGVANNL